MAAPYAREESKAEWPVYTMPYSCMGVQKQLRLEWHHAPERRSDVEVVIQCLKDYIKNPKDQTSSDNGTTFKTYLPDCCIVQSNPHKTKTSKTDRAPDVDYHISVRFGKLADRANSSRKPWGYSVHIYLNESTNKYNPAKPIIWGKATPDRDEQREVYIDRTEWPPNADATTAPRAPGEQVSAPTSIPEGLTPASIPAINPWGGSRSPSPRPNPSQSGQDPGRGPSSGAPPVGRGRGG